MCLILKENAVFVADSHYNDKNQEFKQFLIKLEKGELETSQLFLMGDMFDFISGESKYFIRRNQELINIINKLSTNIEIIYLEGNHDYNMKTLFPNVEVIKREKQPLKAKYEDKTVKISHGDIYTPWHYNFYCKIIRNHIFLVFMNLIDIKNLISKKIYNSLIKKNICSKMTNFEEFAKRRLDKYDSDIVIEGHFHQGKSFEKDNKLYINIPSLCCGKKYTRFKKDFIGEDL